jgi:CheY-like chemotaxis protein
MEKTMMALSGAEKMLERKDCTAFADEPLEVLLVEDDDADAFLIRKALKKISHVSHVVHVHDGIEALNWLDSGMAAPKVAIIDLHMPRKNGHSLLIELRCRPEWNFPTIVLTSSRAREDATRSRLRGANHFMTKPDTVEELHIMLTGVMKVI